MINTFTFEELPPQFKKYVPISKYGQYIRPRTITQWIDLVTRYNPEFMLDEEVELELFPYLFGEKT